MKTNVRVRENISGDIVIFYDSCNLLQTVFKSVSVEVGFIMFLEKVSNIVHFRSYHLSWSSINYFHIFIYIFIQFGNRKR